MLPIFAQATEAMDQILGLRRVCFPQVTKIVLMRADAGYATRKLAAWAAVLKMTIEVVAPPSQANNQTLT